MATHKAKKDEQGLNNRTLASLFKARNPNWKRQLMEFEVAIKGAVEKRHKKH